MTTIENKVNPIPKPNSTSPSVLNLLKQVKVQHIMAWSQHIDNADQHQIVQQQQDWRLLHKGFSFSINNMCDLVMARKYNRQEHLWFLIQNGEQSDNIVRNQLVGMFIANEEVLTGSKMLVGTGKDKQQILESKVVWRGKYWQEWGATKVM